MPLSGRITIVDVARRAAVSRQTVSRVLNGNPSVAADTHARVQCAIDELHFVPNRAARCLHGRPVMAVGLFVPFSSGQIAANNFFSEVIASISETCSRNGTYLNLLCFEDANPDPERIIRLYREKSIRGLIVTCPGEDDPLLQSLVRYRIPCVVIGRPPVPDHTIRVDFDVGKIARDCTRHLLDLGHRRIAFLNGPSFMTYSSDLLDGYRRELEAEGIPYDPMLVRETNLLEASGDEMAAALFEEAPGFSAIFSANDHLALGAMKAAARAGRSIPRDLSLVSGSWSTWNALLAPALTAMRSNYGELGRVAIRQLLRLISEKPDRIPNEESEEASKADGIPVSFILESCLEPGESCARYGGM